MAFTGYRGDLAWKNREWARQMCSGTAFEAVMSYSLQDVQVYTLDELVTARDTDQLTHVENQAQMNSCGGHGGSTAFERLYSLLYGVDEQFSRMYLYLKGKAVDNIRGDNGMTISGGVKTLMKGICRESVFPYPSRYSESIPSGAAADAVKWKLGASVDIQEGGNEVAQRLLGHNMGALYCGCQWNNTMSNPVNGVIERWNPQSGSGGHAWAMVALADRQDSNGLHYYWLANSWGTNWGLGGFAMISPSAFAGMLAHGWTEAFGLTGLAIPEPAPKRKISFHFGR